MDRQGTAAASAAPVVQEQEDARVNRLIREREAALIAARRKAWGELPRPLSAPPIGLALSGGGIRSATFSLGVTQAFADTNRLPEVDYLSTVSGGGYTGTFLGSLFLPRYGSTTLPYVGVDAPTPAAALETPAAAGARAIELLKAPPHLDIAQVGTDPPTAVFHPLRWLRENGRYLTPRGAADTLYLAAFYLRAFIGVHYVLGLALLGMALGVYLLRFGVGLAARLPLAQPYATALDPLGWAAPAASGVIWASPLFLLVPLVLLLYAGPLLVTYWLVYRQDDRQRPSTEEKALRIGPYVLGVAFAVVAVLLGAHGNPLAALAAYCVVLVAIGLLWRDVVIRRRLGAQWQTFSGKVAQARQWLTKWLANALLWAGLVAALGLVDSIGQAFFVALIRGELIAWGSGGIGVAALVLALRQLAKLGKDAKGWITFFVAYQKPVAMVVGVLALLLLAALWVAVVQFAVWSPDWLDWMKLRPKELMQPSADTQHWVLFAAFAAVWAGLFFIVWVSKGFLNNSTFHRFYAARLTRTFLGAANLSRLRDFHDALDKRRAAEQRASGAPGGSSETRSAADLFVQESHLQDDIGLKAYYGGASAGPLHLINVTLNESVSQTSNLLRDDRKGVPLCVGPAGISVERVFHPWRAAPDNSIQYGEQVEPLDAPAGDDGVRCERLTAGQWAAISGAAVSTGLGSMSSIGFSILTWLANARLGYWWTPAPLMRAVAANGDGRLKGAYQLVEQEMLGAFIGRPDRTWNLSDGGHFENTAVYELVRRQAAFVVCCDNGADPKYEFPDVQNLARRVRVDFGADVQFLDAVRLDEFVDAWLEPDAGDRALFGSAEDFRAAARRDGLGCCEPTDLCALLAIVRHSRSQCGGQPRRTLLLVIKPTVARFASADVRLYARDNPEFPQQTTADQFFDEAQWESYRRLGFEVGHRLLARWDNLLVAAQALHDGSYDTELRQRIEQRRLALRAAAA